jgi:hypothetical protein
MLAAPFMMVFQVALRFLCSMPESGPSHLVTDFGEFLKVVEKQKERAAMFDDESDMSESCVSHWDV